MKQFSGNITGWEIHKLSQNRGSVFSGTVLSDSHKFNVGWHMRSSLIVKIRKEEDHYEVETLNSIYHLWGPRGDKVLPFRGDAVLSIFY